MVSAPLQKLGTDTIIADFPDNNDEKTIGKPYAGKPHVRFEEGELISGVLLVCFLLYCPLVRQAKLGHSSKLKRTCPVNC